MKLVVRVLSYLLVLAILGCGGTTMTNPSGNSAALNGSFSFIALSQNSGTNIFTLGGPIQTDPSGHVTANFGITSVAPTNTCFPAGSAGSFSGTIDSGGQLSMTSVAINGQTISVTGTLNSNGIFTSRPGYTITGGCLAGDHGTFFVSSLLVGSFTGSFLTTNGLVGVTVTFGPPGLPNADTSFPLTGTATFSNTAGCGGFTTATMSNGTQPGLGVSFTLNSNLAGNTISFNGTTIDGSDSQFVGSFALSGGPCNGSNGQVTLKKT